MAICFSSVAVAIFPLLLVNLDKSLTILWILFFNNLFIHCSSRSQHLCLFAGPPLQIPPPNVPLPFLIEDGNTLVTTLPRDIQSQKELSHPLPLRTNQGAEVDPVAENRDRESQRFTCYGYHKRNEYLLQIGKDSRFSPCVVLWYVSVFNDKNCLSNPIS